MKDDPKLHEYEFIDCEIYENKKNEMMLLIFTTKELVILYYTSKELKVIIGYEAIKSIEIVDEFVLKVECSTENKVNINYLYTN